MNFVFGISFGNGCAAAICELAEKILYLINNVFVPLIFAIAFLVFIYGVARAYILSTGDQDEIQKGHQLILWGIIGFVVMLSLWGLVNVVATSFGLTGFGAPSLPTFY